MNRVAGFTLLEVMIALAVVAIALGAIIDATGGNARNQNHLRDKTFAHWVATDAITELQVRGDFSALGLRSGSREMAGKEWYWHIELEKTPDERVNLATARVRLDSDGEVVATVSGYLALRGRP